MHLKVVGPELSMPRNFFGPRRGGRFLKGGAGESVKIWDYQAEKTRQFSGSGVLAFLLNDNTHSGT
jgi:hypothetical protein